MTGLTVMLSDLSGKRLELLKEDASKDDPCRSVCGVRGNVTAVTGYKETEEAAPRHFRCGCIRWRCKRPRILNMHSLRWQRVTTDGLVGDFVAIW